MKTTKSDLLRCFSEKPVCLSVYENIARPTVFVIACTYLCLCMVLSVSSCWVSVLLWQCWWHAVLLQGSIPDENSGLANAWLALPFSLHCCIICLQDISQQTDSLGLKRLHVIVPPSANRAVDHSHYHYILNVYGRWWYSNLQHTKAIGKLLQLLFIIVLQLIDCQWQWDVVGRWVKGTSPSVPHFSPALI